MKIYYIIGMKNNFDEIEKHIIQITEQEFREINIDIGRGLKSYSPLGWSGRLQKMTNWHFINPHRSGRSLSSGIASNLPYADRINRMPLHHISEVLMRSSRIVDKSFGTEYGKERADWAKKRYGTDTKQRQYNRGYRRAREGNLSQKYAVKYIERSIIEAKCSIDRIDTLGRGSVYYIDCSKRLQRAIDRELGV